MAQLVGKRGGRGGVISAAVIREAVQSHGVEMTARHRDMCKRGRVTCLLCECSAPYIRHVHLYWNTLQGTKVRVEWIRASRSGNAMIVSLHVFP
jgi:hypothetical protein